ncbi:hypothetical protein PPTG_19221 [Phytophthora nicotianae INRA-310]|uniref:Uncharacterized protein n=1 Tax=Phytophthora nicotianae (strain INRA-310) TaxID=761204 RepID=W2PDI2_PHYN3|nr:hypothetical protein PPTG_19221 [Phytophthora nicotianae INRA-310]ETM98891.1 hypothetical protein PPTG_19221 [Phytophthora nicotianae INRA-310]
MAVQTHPENVKDSGVLNRESSFLSRVENKWNAIQVGRQGEYSIERVESLDHYCKTASKTRVLLVCILTPVPALAVAIILEMMPLQDPSKGWDANWIFWIRVTVICFILTWEAHDVISLPNVRLWACEPHPISSDRLEILKTLSTSDVYGSRSCHTIPTKANASLSSSLLVQTRRVLVAPIGPTESVVEKTHSLRNPRVSTSILNTQVFGSERSKKKLITQGLQLLFHCEYLVLVEYIECVVPIVFVTYQSVLRQLPNVIYAPEGAEGWQSGPIGTILLFAVLEVCSLLALKVLLERKFAFSPLYQLAYVLETQLEFVQTDVFIATIVLLPFELVHFGMDFTLRFEWLRSSST